eukprot:scaffold246069_cov32-Tisochrysis_lutea.AAC.1
MSAPLLRQLAYERAQHEGVRRRPPRRGVGAGRGGHQAPRHVSHVVPPSIVRSNRTRARSRTTVLFPFGIRLQSPRSTLLVLQGDATYAKASHGPQAPHNSGAHRQCLGRRG